MISCAAAFADSYDEVLDPLLVKLLEAVEATENDEDYQEAIDARKNICSTNAFASAMTLGTRAPHTSHSFKLTFCAFFVRYDRIELRFRNGREGVSDGPDGAG